jgi:hypothetical protein
MRVGSLAGLISRKDDNSRNSNVQTIENEAVIPNWGSPASKRRRETEPIAKFQIARRNNSVEVTFEPPVYVLGDLTDTERVDTSS